MSTATSRPRCKVRFSHRRCRRSQVVDLAVRYWPAGAAAQVGGDFYDVFALGRQSLGDPDRRRLRHRTERRRVDRHRASHGACRGASQRRATPPSSIGSTRRSCTRAATSSARAAMRPSSRPREGLYRLVSTPGAIPCPSSSGQGGETTTLGESGTLLGVFDELSTTTAETTIGPGDVVVFYTDGIADLPPPYGLDLEEVTAMIAGCCQGGYGRRHRRVDLRLRHRSVARDAWPRRHRARRRACRGDPYGTR